MSIGDLTKVGIRVRGKQGNTSNEPHIEYLAQNAPASREKVYKHLSAKDGGGDHAIREWTASGGCALPQRRQQQASFTTATCQTRICKISRLLITLGAKAMADLQILRVRIATLSRRYNSLGPRWLFAMRS